MPELESDARPPDDYAEFLAAERPLTIVGGQAINLWALHYDEETAGLEPFVSRDIDVIGDRETLKEIAQLTNTKPQYFSLRPPSNEVGVVVARDPAGEPLLIEVLRYINGATIKEIENPIYTFEVGASNVQVQIPSPFTLLKAKIANLSDIPQRGRQDSRHIQILFSFIPSYFRDVEAAVKESRRKERELISLLEFALVIVSSKKAPSILKSLELDAVDLFGGLRSSGLPKVRSFLEKRLPRVMM